MYAPLSLSQLRSTLYWWLQQPSKLTSRLPQKHMFPERMFLGDWSSGIVGLFTSLCFLFSFLKKLSSASTCISSTKTDRELEKLCSRIWNMLMNRYNKKPSLHMQEGKKLKICEEGVCAFPTLMWDAYPCRRAAFGGCKILSSHQDSPSCFKTSVIMEIALWVTCRLPLRL